MADSMADSSPDSGEETLDPREPLADLDDGVGTLESDEVVRDEQPSRLLPFLVVGIGASAGGIESFIKVLDHLPPNTGMAFVFVSHLTPHRETQLPQILERHTAMPVTLIEGGLSPAPDQLYIMPPDVTLTIQDGVFQLTARPQSKRPPQPIDIFFRSLGSDQKNRAVGIVLSGTDSDGASGLLTIKGEGGLSIVQAPETALYGSMPRNSIAADHTDFILAPEEIGPELMRIASQFRRPELTPLKDGDPVDGEEQHFSRILQLLRISSGIEFRHYKPATLRRRLARRLMLTRVGSLAEYARYLQVHPEELISLREDALINVTRFFRDPEMFQGLHNILFPILFADRTEQQPVRVWVAACASGEEAYSVAICLLEYFHNRGLLPPIQVFGSDVSERSIERARTAIYPETIATEMSAQRLNQFFVKVERGYQLARQVRDACIFARHNLSQDPPFSRLDLITCRNALIYFGPQMQRKIVPVFHYALRPSGFLVLGISESIRDFPDLFTPYDRKLKFFSKVNAQTQVNFDLARRRPAEAAAQVLPPPGSPAHWVEAEVLRAADRIVLSRFAPARVLIDEDMNIVYSRGPTAQFLHLAAGPPTLNLLRMLRDGLSTVVKQAIERCVAQGLPAVTPTVTVHGEGPPLSVRVQVLPIQVSSLRRKHSLVLFEVAEPGSQTHLDPTLLPEAGDRAEERDTQQLRSELDATRYHLRALGEEHEARNHDLVSANEEIQSANEELQSTNEELETAKEELQSSIEELQTVNEELQQRNQILTRTMNDFNNLQTAVDIPLLMLDNNFHIRQFTPAAQRLLSVRPNDIGRPIDEIRLNLEVQNFDRILREVLETLVPQEMEARDRTGRWHQLRVRPYRTSDDRIDGVVVVLVDIDQLRSGQEELRQARDFARSVIESVQIPLVVLDQAFRITSVNSAFRTLAGLLASDAVESHSFPDLFRLFWGPGPVRARLEELVAGGAESAFEFEHQSLADSRILQFRGRIVRQQKQPVVLLTVEDVTERREAERLLRGEKRALEGRVELAAHVLGETQDELRGLAAHLFTIQEEERRVVARELHDDISQKLAVLNMGIREAQTGAPDHVLAQLEELRAEAQVLADDVRALSHRLHPAMLSDLGLVSALKALVEEFGAREKMPATFAQQNLPDHLSQEVSTVLFRIAQEALRNVAKHAGKTHVKLTLEATGSALEMQVVDLGEGFDPEGGPRGLGLISMAERARLVGGQFGIRSALGRGTTVSMQVPLARAMAADGVPPSGVLP